MSGWTDASLSYLARVDVVLTEMANHWPLTLRQVYYRLVASEQIENNRNSYQKLSRTLVKARLDGLVSYDAIEDRSRTKHCSASWHDWTSFVDDELLRCMSYFRRDRLQSQSVAVEVWVEKDALSRLCIAAAQPYGVPVIVARGFSSLSFVHECYERVLENADVGKRTVLLYFGDMDPSGWEMLPTMMETLQDKMGLGDRVEGIRCGLTPEQIEQHALPHSPDALKATDSRAKKYVRRFGHLAVELDALPPDVLQDLVSRSIEAHLDLNALEAQRKSENRDREKLRLVQSRLEGVIAEVRS